ncbi:hypothetical protein [Streptomyces sp. Midd1]|uniref:hypothetical protein n=1 Tax=Streptomyces sp. Midd3 TaxID=3161191 RepID=UPI0034DAF767
MAARVGMSTLARGAASEAVTSAASSGSISAGTASASSGSRLLSAAQFANAGAHAVSGGRPNRSQGSAQAPGGDQSGWLRG